MRIENHILKALEAAGVRSVLVAVSGGADSVALLCACARVAPRLGLRLEAANCNFHLRGAESDRDSDFTAALCERLGIPLHRLDYDVAAYQAEHPGASTEMACRELRYADFFRLCQERGLDRVATAHNADDDIETLMLALLRGSGTRGLRGMDADNGRVIRPLLGITRTEIEAYLNAIGQDFVTDSSNLTSDYRRNFLRRDVLPLLETRWPGARKSLARTLSIMKEESEIVEAHYRRQLEELCPDSRTLLFKTAPETAPEPARGGWKPPSHGSETAGGGCKQPFHIGTILRFLEPFGGNTAIAAEIRECFGKEFAERRWRLSERYEAVLERDRVVIADKDVETHEPSIIWESLEMTPGLIEEIKRNRSHDVIYLPNDCESYELRRPQMGDRMAPLGMKGTRLVSDIISDARLDRRAKDAVRVLIRRSDGEIVWVTGLKRSRDELVSPTSASVYRAKVTSDAR